MELKVKILKGWSTGMPVAMLNFRTAEKIGAHTQERVLIKTLGKNPRELSTIIDTVGKLVKENEIVVSSEIKKILELGYGEEVEVNLMPVPQSMIFIKKKLNGGKLNKKEIEEIITSVVNNSLSEAEIAMFVTAMYEKGMSKKETIFLVSAIFETGSRIVFPGKYIVDKHSIGGIPGNRTTPIVVAICTSAGLIMPKSSSRAITTSAGTADVIETIAQVDFTEKEIKKIVKKTNGCLVWGGSLGLAPADDKIIQIEKQLKIDPEAQLLASIMAKKLALGSKYILIDIPYGKTAKVNKKRALNLKKKFEELGKVFHKKIRVVLTDGSQPMGNGVGPAMELRDVIDVLDQSKSGPKDLENKSIFLAGQIFEMTGKSKKNQGELLARKILHTGRAFEKFQQIIKAQNGKINSLRYAKFSKTIISNGWKRIKEIDNKKINSFARVAGCPADKYAGLYLYKHVGDKLKKGDKILTIYTESKFRLKEALKFYKREKPILFG